MRDAVDAASATPATSIARFPAVISSNDAITDLPGASKPELTSSITHNFFVALYHRNHVGVMNATPIPYASGVYEYDFSAGSSRVYGGTNAHKQLSTEVWGMMCGDGDGSGTVQTADKNTVWTIQAGTAGYKAGDYNMNRQVNNLDKDYKWLPNLGKGSYIPE